MNWDALRLQMFKQVVRCPIGIETRQQQAGMRASPTTQVRAQACAAPQLLQHSAEGKRHMRTQSIGLSQAVRLRLRLRRAPLKLHGAHTPPTQMTDAPARTTEQSFVGLGASVCVRACACQKPEAWKTAPRARPASRTDTTARPPCVPGQLTRAISYQLRR